MFSDAADGVSLRFGDDFDMDEDESDRDVESDQSVTSDVSPGIDTCSIQSLRPVTTTAVDKLDAVSTQPTFRWLFLCWQCCS